MKTKVWCRHIRWIKEPDIEIGAQIFENKRYYWAMDYAIPVIRSWKVCPICLKERPTKKNIKAAIMVTDLEACDEFD